MSKIDTRFSTVRLYECAFCKDLWESKEEMLKHADECHYNPDHKHAPTCKHFRQYQIVDGLFYYHCDHCNSVVMPDDFATHYGEGEGKCPFELADLSKPIQSLTEEEAEKIRSGQTHQKLKITKVEQDEKKE
jgi:hypothetical protein